MKQKDEEIWIMKHPESRYGVIDAMEREIASCSTSGSHFVILYRSSHELQQRMNDLNEDSLSLLARFTVNHTISDDLLYELYGIPHISYLLDSISHFPSLFKVNSRLTPSVIAFVDGDSKELYEQKQREGAIEAYWIPHAIDPEKIEKRLRGKGVWKIPYEERQYDITISGSWIDWRGDAVYWEENMSVDSCQILKKIAEMVLSSQGGENHLPILQRFLEEDCTFQEEMNILFGDNIEYLFSSLEQYIRGLDRERFCKIADESEASILILTHETDIEKWKGLFLKNSRVEVKGSVQYEETWDYYAQSKVVINSVPTIKKGLHERLLAALFCSSKVISTYSSLIPKEAPWSSVCPLLESIDSSEALMRIVDAPYSIEFVEMVDSWIVENHTWQKRMDLFLPRLKESVEKIRLRRELLLNG
ncbi:MAG: hypothetical protein QRY74_02010 [Chlamydia sp.]